MAGVVVHRPVPEAPSSELGALAAPLGTARPIRLALVANGKPNSAELLDALARRIGDRLPITEVRRYRKPSVSVPPDPADLAEIAEWADATLHAVGD